MDAVFRNIFVVASLLVGGSAMAAVITPDFNPDTTACDYDGADQTCWAINRFPPSQPTLEEFAAYVGEDPTDFEELYKDETDGKNPGEESGTFENNYTTAWNPADDEEEAFGATISWDGGSFIACGVCYLWVKDGNADPSLYIFDIGWWDGQEDLVLDGFWQEGPGAISNVGIFGQGGDMQVSEPGTLALLGLGLIGLGLSRRRRTPA